MKQEKQIITKNIFFAGFVTPRLYVTCQTKHSSFIFYLSSMKYYVFSRMLKIICTFLCFGIAFVMDFSVQQNLHKLQSKFKWLDSFLALWLLSTCHCLKYRTKTYIQNGKKSHTKQTNKSLLVNFRFGCHRLQCAYTRHSISNKPLGVVVVRLRWKHLKQKSTEFLK